MEIETDDLMRFMDRYSLGRDRGLGPHQFLRIKVPAGTLTSEQLRAIAQMSDDYGRGYTEITDRQDIQLHWIEGEHAPKAFARMEKLGFTTDKCGQAFPGARYGDVRNIVVCPVAGVDRDELIDVRPLAKKMNDFFIGNRDFLDMPKKFKISITGCDIRCTKPEVQDIGLFAVEHEGEVGFAALIGGGVGATQPGPRLAEPLGAFIKPSDVFDVTRAMAEIHRDHGNRESKAKARFKYLVANWGVQQVREKLEEKLGRKLEPLEVRPRISGEEHSGIQEQKDGNYFITIPLIGGILSSERMRRVSDIVDEFGSGEVRNTTFQNMILVNIPQDGLEDALKQLGDIDLPVRGPPLRWTAIGCAADFCGKAAEPYPKQMARGIVEHLERRFGTALDDLKLRLYVSGCSNDCCLRTTGDIGLMGIPVSASEARELYHIYLGGRLGEKAQLSKLVAKKVDPEHVRDVIERLVDYCLKEGFADFAEFCASHSAEELGSMVQLEVK